MSDILQELRVAPGGERRSPFLSGFRRLRSAGGRAFRRLKFEAKMALALLLVFGAAALEIVPPFTTYDAPSHAYRAQQISQGTLRAERYSKPGLGGDLPAPLVEYVDALWEKYWYKHDFGTPTEWRSLAAEKSNLAGNRRVEFSNTANYSPLNYGFQSTGMFLARTLSRSPYVAHQLGALFNLLGYALLVVAAVQIAPAFERGFLLLATCPVIVCQAASLSADAVNVSVPLLLVALVWRLRVASTPSPRLLVAALVVGIAAVLLKPTMLAALLCTAWIPARQFGTLRRKGLILAATYVTAALAWWSWNRLYFDLEIATWFQIEHPSKELIKTWFLHDPLAFAPPLWRAVRFDIWQQAPAFFGNVGGWGPHPAYPYLPIFTAVFLSSLALVPTRVTPVPRDVQWSVAMLVQAAGYYVLLCLVFWLTFGVVGQTFVPGMQGRYFYPVYLPLAAAFAELAGGYGLRARRWAFWLGLAASVGWITVVLLHTAVMTRC